MSDIEIGQLAEGLTAKADRDLNNLSVKTALYTNLGNYTIAKDTEITFPKSLFDFDYITAEGDYYLLQGKNNGTHIFLSGFFSGLDSSDVYYAQVYNITLRQMSGTKFKVASHSWADLYGTTINPHEISRAVSFYGVKIN